MEKDFFKSPTVLGVDNTSGTAIDEDQDVIE